MFVVHTKFINYLVKTEEKTNRQNPNTVLFCNSFSKMSPSFKKIEAKLQQLELVENAVSRKSNEV